MSNTESKKTKFKNFQAALRDMQDSVESVAEGFWNTLFGIEPDYLAPDPTPTSTFGGFLKELNGTEQYYAQSAVTLASRFKIFARAAFHEPISAEGAPNDCGNPLMDEDYPENMDYVGGCEDYEVYPGSIWTADNASQILSDEAWHSEVGATLVSTVMENAKVLLESPLLTISPDQAATYLNTSGFSDTNIILNLSDGLPKVIDAAAAYLLLIEGFGFTAKTDIPSAPNDDTKAGVIPTDSVMQKSLANLTSNSTHYIGFLLDPEKSNDEVDEYYLPIRYSPYDEMKYHAGEVSDWNSEGYRFLDEDGDLFTPEAGAWQASNGVPLPYGLGVVVTEIVESTTGVWVGFVFDETDDLFDEDFIEDLTGNVLSAQHVLYTRPEYLRKRIGSLAPDPLISHNVIVSDSVIKKIEENLSAGLKKIDPKNNTEWLNLFPEEAALSYYNFIEHNRKAQPTGYYVNQATIIDNPVRRYSHGFFYFIVGTTSRPPESETGSTEEAKLQASQASIGEAKEQAWFNLLKYFDKEREGVRNQALYQNLKTNFFVPVSVRVNTNSTGPNNQKVLFAIRASYIDGLPDSNKPYMSNFDMGSPYLGGKNFAIAMYAGKVREACNKLKGHLKTVIEDKIGAAPNAIIDANGEDFQLNTILELLEGSSAGDFPTLLSQFLRKNAYPASTKQDRISELIKEAATAIVEGNDSKHIIQIGIKDNGQVGDGVRETISYVLFSPDPESLKDTSSNNFNLFYFDPYITQDELTSGNIRRSAVPLRIGLEGFRQSFDGVYGTMLLHFLLSSPTIAGLETKMGARNPSKDEWTKLLLAYSVPTLKITANPDSSAGIDPEEDKCDEWIEELNSSTNVWGPKERVLFQKIKERCKKNIFDKYKEATPATDPEITKRELENKSQGLDNLDDAKSPNATPIPWQLKFLYKNLLNAIDIEGIIALILACLSHKLGIQFTAQEICKAAILELLKQMGADKFQAALLQSALENPDRFGVLIGALNNAPSVQEALDINDTYKEAPIAAYMILLSEDWEEKYLDYPQPDWLGPDVISAIRQLEMNNISVEFEPADRPQIPEQYQLGITFPDDGFGSALVGSIYQDDQISFSQTYTLGEIEAERKRLFDLGYTPQEVQAMLVYNGFLRPKYSQYQPLLSGGLLDPVSDTLLEVGQAYPTPTGAANLQGAAMALQDAQDYLDWLLSIINLQEICELLVGSLLEGLEDLLKDPLGFLSGGIGEWFDNFVDGLKRKFSFPEPRFKFPDNLQTDTHMGDYGPKLLEMLLTLVIVILAQVLNVVIKDALMKCFEEADEDLGTATNPSPNTQPPLRIPNLDSILGGKAPSVAGNLPFPAAAGLMDDLLGNLQFGQLCSLLKGEASKATLYSVLQQIKSREQIMIEQAKMSFMLQAGLGEQDATLRANKAVKSSLQSMTDVKNMFVNLGKQIDLQICEVISPAMTVIDDVCTAFYDVDGKSIELQEAGLTKEEADNQIEQDLEGLKNKVLAYAPMLFPNGKGLGEGLSAVPDICDIPGAFTVPPGIENAMNMITDNILDTVKGSLIQDMYALKFFSVPPRAVQAITDPAQMLEAHEMFRTAISNPFQKNALAFIGYEPGHLRDQHDIDLDSNLDYGESNIRDMQYYPCVYGTAGLAYDGYRVYRVPNPDAPGQTMAAFEYTSPERERELLIQNAVDSPIAEDDIFDHKFFKPATFIKLLENKNYLSSGTQFKSGATDDEGNALKRKKEYILRELLVDVYVSEKEYSYENATKLIKDTWTIDTLIEKATSSGVRPLVEKKLTEYFSQDTKPIVLSEMLYQLEDLIKPLHSNMSQDGAGGFGFLSSDIVPPHPFHTIFDWNKATLLSIPQPLHTPLWQINPNPNVWKMMYVKFTGLNYYTDGGHRIWGTPTPSAVMGSGQDTDPLIVNPRSSYSDSGPYSGGSNLSYSWASLMEKSPGYIKCHQAASKFWSSGDLPGMPLHQSVAKSLERMYGDWYKWGPIRTMEEQKDDNETGLGSHTGLGSLIGFMELSLGEALGLDSARFRKLYPNMPGPFVEGVIFTTRRTSQYSDTIGPDQAGDTSTYQMLPLYVTFKQTYVDPESPFAEDPQAMIERFSSEKDPVNPELFKYLTDSNNFPQHIGFGNSRRSRTDIKTLDTDNKRQEFQKLELYENYNPNILKWDLPFTEMFAKTIEGSGGTVTLDGNQKVQEIFKVFQGTTYGDDNLDNLINSLQVSSKNHTLVYQHAHGGKKDDFKAQASPFVDAYRVAKGKTTGIEDYSVPPGMYFDKASINNELFDFNLIKEFDEDVKGLISDMYGGHDPVLGMLEVYEKNKANVIQNEIEHPYFVSHPGAEAADASPPYHLSLMNFKGQLFGQLLTYKLFKKLNDGPDGAQGYDRFPNSIYAEENNNSSMEKAYVSDEQMMGRLGYILSSHGYSSLQYAYSTQMFAKLKRSRLQERGFMKKLWDKILSSTGAGAVNPACRDLFAHLEAVTAEEAKSSKTDFFRIGEVKEEILEYYRISLCRDVYEKADVGDNAVRIGLIQAVVKLLIKVFSLEMCLASIISWDSFNIDEIFRTDIMSNIIINNIEAELKTIGTNPDNPNNPQSLSKEKLGIYAKNIIKKDYGIRDDEQLANFLKEKSALRYMIEREGIKISEIVRSLFNNPRYNPITADLNLEILTISDPDFDTEFKKKVYPNLGLEQDYSLAEYDPIRYRQLSSNGIGSYDYVVDARFTQNIYTMNYGSGYAQDLLRTNGVDINQLAPGQGNAADDAQIINMYGFYSDDDGLRSTPSIFNRPGNSKAKNFFHSLPYNFYQPSGVNNDWGIAKDSPSMELFQPRSEYSRALLDVDEAHFPDTVPDFEHSVDVKVSQYAYRALANYSNIYDPDRAHFIKINDLMTKHLGRADAFNKEMFRHTQIGNAFNGAFGNVTMEPYIKVVDWTVAEFEEESYSDKFKLIYYQQTEDDPASLDICENPYYTFEKGIEEVGVADFMADLNKWRNENNIFNSYIFDHVPLGVWSYFYTEKFLAALHDHPLKDFYDAFGFEPFFKNIKFGIRLNYSTVRSIDKNVTGDMSLNLDHYMKNKFGPGNLDLPGINYDVPAWGLKASKTFYNNRPYFADQWDHTGTKNPVPYPGGPDARMKICDELLVPIVEVEYEITSTDLEGTGFALHRPGSAGQAAAIYPLSQLGVYNPETYDILEGIGYPEPPQYDIAEDLSTYSTAEIEDEEGDTELPEIEEVLFEPIGGASTVDIVLGAQLTAQEYTQKLKSWLEYVQSCATVAFSGPGWFEGHGQYDYDWMGQDCASAQKFGYPTDINTIEQITGQQYINRVKEVLKRFNDPTSTYVKDWNVNQWHPDKYLTPSPIHGSDEEIYFYKVGTNLNTQLLADALADDYFLFQPGGGLHTPSCDEQGAIKCNNAIYYTWAIVAGTIDLTSAGDLRRTSDFSPSPNFKSEIRKRDFRHYLRNNIDSQNYEAIKHMIPSPEPELPPQAPAWEWTGPYIPELDGAQSAVYGQVGELLTPAGGQAMNHLTNNFHQFFYKNLAQTMVRQLQNTPEFKLMYEHLFPMRSYMAMSFAFAGDSLSKYIPEPTDVLDITKGTLLQIMTGLENSLDYTFLPDSLADFLKREMEGQQTDTKAKRPDLGKLILMIIIRTSLLILKGFVEVTDPAIIIAKAIIDIANAIQQSVIAAIETGIRIAEQVAQAARDIAHTTMRTVEASIGAAIITPKMMLEMSLTIPATPEGKLLKEYVTIDTDTEGLENWIFEIDDFPNEAEVFLQETDADIEDLKDTWAELQELMLELQGMQQEYTTAKTQYEDADKQVTEVIGTLKKDLEEAKKVLKDIFKSPYLLPGMWAAMIPSMMHLGGGLMPPPLPGGPPSTIPGMIYLALLFFDDWEEAQHKNAQEQNGETGCEDEL